MIVIRFKHDHGVFREEVFSKLPITIGRGPDNDFILADDSVSKQHARIDLNESGIPIITDLGSRNGIRIGNTPIQTMPLLQMQRCYLGVAEIEVEPVSTEVTRIIRITEWQQFNRRRSLRDHLKIVLSCCIGWLVHALSQPFFWSPVQDDRQLMLILELLAVIVALPIGSFLLLIVMRTIGRKLRIADCLQLCNKIIWLFAAVTLSSKLLYYAPTSTFHIASTVIFFGATIWAAVLVASLRRQPETRRFQWATAASVTAIYLILGLAMHLANEIHGDAPATDYFVLPPVAGQSGYSVTLERYLKSFNETAADAADEAKNSRRKNLERGTP